MYRTDENPRQSTSIKTVGVLLLLIVAAAILSYLWAYALSDALIAGHLMTADDAGVDARPAQMREAFFVITSILTVSAGFLKWISARHLRRIDAMNRE